MATRDLGRLGARVYAHRVQKFTSYKLAAEAGGISKETWKSIEDGNPAWPRSYAGVERALDWGDGSCIAIAEGGEPVLVDTSRDVTSEPVRKPRAEVIRGAVFTAARLKLKATAVGDLDGFADELVDVLRGVGEVDDDD